MPNFRSTRGGGLIGTSFDFVKSATFGMVCRAFLGGGAAIARLNVLAADMLRSNVQVTLVKNGCGNTIEHPVSGTPFDGATNMFMFVLMPPTVGIKLNNMLDLHKAIDHEQNYLKYINAHIHLPMTKTTRHEVAVHRQV